MFRVNINDFPKLEIDNSNVYASWRSWLTQFRLSIEMATMNMGTEMVAVEGGGQQAVNVFRGRRKLVALISAIGDAGRTVLESVGFDMDQGTYEQALQALTNHYGQDETIFIKTVKVINAKQAAGESEIDYLLRVERVTRELGIIADDANRSRFAVGIAVNGLREQSLRTRLFERPNLTWDQLTDTLRTRNMAQRSEAVLESSKTTVNVKQEVDAVSSTSSCSCNCNCSSKSKSSNEVNEVSRSSRSHKRSSSRSSRDSSRSSDRSSKSKKSSKGKSSSSGSSSKSMKCYGCGVRGHEIRYCPNVRCYYCKRRGHTMKDCKKRKETHGSDSDSSRSSRSRSPSRRVSYAESSNPS